MSFYSFDYAVYLDFCAVNRSLRRADAWFVFLRSHDTTMSFLTRERIKDWSMNDQHLAILGAKVGNGCDGRKLTN
jgi:hypothetical protein